jgi:flagellar hook-associated protein 1 FlgK
MTIFGSIETGRSALQAQLKGMAVSGQNVANANTPGYSRQRVDLVAAVPALTGGLSPSPGYGVEVAAITRMRSEFYHNQAMNAYSYLAYWEMNLEAYGGAEIVFMEPGESGLSGYFGDFFDSWQELSGSPESAAVRMSLRKQAVSFTDAVRDTYLRLGDLKVELENEFEKRVREINELAAEVAVINEQVTFAGALGESPNALLDQLDLALEQLSGLVDIRVYHKESGAVEIFAGGRLLVQDQQCYGLSLETRDNELRLLSSRGVPLEMRSGRLKGLEEAVNRIIPGLQGQLDEIVGCLVENVNALHRRGYGLDGESGRVFFAEIEDGALPISLQFKLDEAVLNDSAVIAAASRWGGAGEPGETTITGLNVSTQEDADLAIETIQKAIDTVSAQRSMLGAYQNRLEHTIANLGTSAENLQAAESRIRDVDMAEEIMEFTKANILNQAATAMLAQANIAPQTVLQLLG